nr:MAG TPA: hypothetical protein [Caudoviricetes sp.]
MYPYSQYILDISIILKNIINPFFIPSLLKIYINII